MIRDTTASESARFIIKWGTGYVGIGTSNPGHLLQVGNAAMPAYCDGSVWVNSSDRNSKENFKPMQLVGGFRQGCRPATEPLELQGRQDQ